MKAAQSNRTDLLDTPETLPPHRDVPVQTVGAEIMVRDPQEGQVHFFNPSAAIVWACCDGVTTLAACEAALRKAFVIPPTVDLQSDIRETVEEFRLKGLLASPEG